MLNVTLLVVAIKTCDKHANKCDVDQGTAVLRVTNLETLFN